MEGSFLERQERESLVSIPRPLGEDPQLDLVDVQGLANRVYSVRGLLNVVSIYEYGPTQVSSDSYRNVEFQLKSERSLLVLPNVP